MRVLYGLCTIGLGHVTRSAPVIEGLLERGHGVDIMSHGPALALAKRIFAHRVRYIDFDDFDLPVVERPWTFVPLTVIGWPRIEVDLRAERRQVRTLVRRHRYDLIIADGRLGMHHRDVPSYLINHQLRLMTMRRFGWVEWIGEWYMWQHCKHYTGIIVPDDPAIKLAGEMAHDLDHYHPARVFYPGFLSSFTRRDTDEHIDTLISISGPDPGRRHLMAKCIKEAQDLPGRTVVMTGRDESDRVVGRVEVLGLVDNQRREELMNAAKVCVARAGYSSLMDLMVLRTPAVLMPTIGQTEQMYLARHLQDQGLFRMTTIKELDLARDIELAMQRKPLAMDFSTPETVQRILEYVGA